MAKHFSKILGLLLSVLVAEAIIRGLSEHASTCRLIELTTAEGGAVVLAKRIPWWLPKSVLKSEWFARIQRAGWLSDVTQIHLHSATARVTPIAKMMCDVPTVNGVLFDYSPVIF